MSGTSPLLGARWPLVAPHETDWLYEVAGDGVTGFMPPPMPDAVWVLNAMYEHERGPSGVSYDDRHRALVADGTREPRLVGSVDLNTVGTVTGGGLGRAEHPGAGWRRLRWAELAERTGDPIVPDGQLPCLHCFPSAKRNGSWPLGIRPSTEGSLDRETYDRLIAILIERSPSGPDTPCLAYYNPLMLGGDFDTSHVRAGRLGHAKALYDNDEADFSPSNLWAADRSWVTCTDYDLWGTKIAGPTSLVEALLNDSDIEAIRLPETA